MTPTPRGKPPMPLTEHPDLQYHAGRVRTYMACDKWHVRLINPVSHAEWFTQSDSGEFGHEPKEIMLSVHKAAAAAPWTGWPYWYVWKVAVDDQDHTRWVAGDAYVEMDRNYVPPRP